MAFGSVPQEGHYVHCGVCGGPTFVRWPLANDFLEYCMKCKSLPLLDEDDVMDAVDILKVITLMASLLRFIGVKETYYR